MQIATSFWSRLIMDQQLHGGKRFDWKFSPVGCVMTRGYPICINNWYGNVTRRNTLTPTRLETNQT